MFVRIDMEESFRVDATLRIYRALRAAGLDNVGIVLQAYLRRSPDDLRGLRALAPSVRLVKGAYSEPAAAAFQSKAEIDEAYAALIDEALGHCAFVAVATHDDRIMERTVAFVRARGSAPGTFEFQMLLGVRDALGDALVARGLPLRVSVPFGADWYPYLMRRMAENPANLVLILRNWRG